MANVTAPVESGETAIDYLEAQHREADALFEALEEASTGDERRDLFETLANKLTIHARVEEQFFYPAVREHRTEELVVEAFVEHTNVKSLLADLMETDPDDVGFLAKLAVLKEQVEHHVEEEENELFPAAKELLTRDELLVLAQEMAVLENQLAGTDPRNLLRDELRDELGIQPALG